MYGMIKDNNNKIALHVYIVTDLPLSRELQLLIDFSKLMPFLLPFLRTALCYFS